MDLVRPHQDLRTFLNSHARMCACECVRVNLTFIILRISIVAGCAFVKYETKEQALGAVEALNGKHTMEVCI